MCSWQVTADVGECEPWEAGGGTPNDWSGSWKPRCQRMILQTKWIRFRYSVLQAGAAVSHCWHGPPHAQFANDICNRFWSMCSLCVHVQCGYSYLQKCFSCNLQDQNSCYDFPINTFIRDSTWGDKCMQGIASSFYSEDSDCSSESSSESDFSSCRTTLNTNAEPGVNTDSISLSVWVVLISGFTLRFSWISSKSVLYLPGYLHRINFAKCYLNWHSPSW